MQIMIQIFLLFLSFLFITPLCAEQGVVTPAYYDYSDEQIEKLNPFSSEYSMNLQELDKWDKFILKFAETQNLTKDALYRLYAYIYTAQRDAATLAYEDKGDFVGSLDPITLAIFQLFYPFVDPPFQIEEDDFSHQLAQIVFPNFKKRFLSEEYNIQKEEHSLEIFYWTGLKMEFSQETLAWTPWVLSPIATAAMAEIFSQKEIERKLAESGNWLNFTNQFLRSKNLPFQKELLLRSVVAIALYDAIITQAKLKYIYGEKEKGRLFALDDSFHSTLGHTVFSLLRFYFPD